MGLDGVELVISVEKHFNITIHDSVAEKLRTVGDLHDFVVRDLRRLQRKDVDPAVVFEQLRELIAYHLGVKRERVVPGARFVQDLDLDQ